MSVDGLTRQVRLAEEAVYRPLRRQILTPGARCAYCGDLATQVDHIVPRSRGGDICDPDNLAPACRLCNMEKGGTTPEEWRAWRESMGWEWPPPTEAVVIRRAAEAALQASTVEFAPGEILRSLFRLPP